MLGLHCQPPTALSSLTTFRHLGPLPTARQRCVRHTAELRSGRRRFSCSAAEGATSSADASKIWETLGAPAADKPRLEAKAVQAIIDATEVPYSSYVAEPRTVLHGVDGRIKEIWVITLLMLAARATSWGSLLIAGGVGLLTVVTQPPRLWKAQLPRLLLLSGLLFAVTALASDGVPPPTQPRATAAIMDGLPAWKAAGSYKYVKAQIIGITVTTRSLRLAAQSASLWFTTLQSATLVLTTTPAEELAVAMRSLLWPLRLLRVPVDEIGLTLLLSLRFMAVAFEEVRNLALGVAARGVKWKELGQGGSLRVVISLFSRLFSRLLSQSETIGEAMVARGFVGPRNHRLYLTQPERSHPFANLVALLALVGCVYVISRYFPL